jgi:hypothetical protein
MFKNTGSGLKIPTLFSGYHHQQEAEPRFVGHVANITVTVGREAVLSCSVTDLQDYKERPPRIIITKIHNITSVRSYKRFLPQNRGLRRC